MGRQRRSGRGGRRWATAAVAFVAVSGAVTASASTLGRLSSTTVGGSATVVTRCDTDGIAISFLNDYDALTDTYKTVEVAMGDVAAACDGLAFRLTLASSSASIRELTGTVALGGGTRQAITLTPSIDAGSITRTALVITG